MEHLHIMYDICGPYMCMVVKRLWNPDIRAMIDGQTWLSYLYSAGRLLPLVFYGCYLTIFWQVNMAHLMLKHSKYIVICTANMWNKYLLYGPVWYAGSDMPHHFCTGGRLFDIYEEQYFIHHTCIYLHIYVYS